MPRLILKPESVTVRPSDIENQAAPEPPESAQDSHEHGVEWFDIARIAFVALCAALVGFQLPYSRFTGAAGIAIFLGALEQITGGRGYRDLAGAVLRPLRQAVRARDASRDGTRLCCDRERLTADGHEHDFLRACCSALRSAPGPCLGPAAANG